MLPLKFSFLLIKSVTQAGYCTFKGFNEILPVILISLADLGQIRYIVPPFDAVK